MFDSGVGGLTVVRALRQALDAEDVLYLGDTARVPYGSKSPRTVARYARACLRFLVERRVKLVLVACNTASATALPEVAADVPVPVIGAVDPGARAALQASHTRHVGVIGTLATIRSGAYERALSALDPEVRVSTLACPLLVPLAEEGWVDGDIAAAVCRRYLSELLALDGRIDTLVLGCTHYPLLRATLARIARELAGRELAIVDSATAMAEAAVEVLAARDDLRAMGEPGRMTCFVTDASRIDELGPRFLGEPRARFELVDL